jgi:hypothetical protein
MRFDRISTFLIHYPPLVLVPFLALVYAGQHWNAGLPLTGAFLYLGAWCSYRHRRCGTPHCGVTGPLYLLVALFSVLDRVPLFAASAVSWSDWDHLFLVFWIGTTAAFGAQWLSSRRSADLAYTSAFLVAALVVYASA